MKKKSDTSNLRVEYLFWRNSSITKAEIFLVITLSRTKREERERERSDGEGGDLTGSTGERIMALFPVILLFLSVHDASSSHQHGKDVDPRPGIFPLSSYASNRKLIVAGVEGGAAPEEGGAEFKTDRIGEVCSEQDIALHQGATTPLPSGIPTYTVRIINICITGCSISDVHLACSWFSTARSINPAIFRRLRYNDCLVNDGKPIPAGGSVSFQYANTYPYTLSVSSATCNP